MPSLPFLPQISTNAHHFGEARHAFACYSGKQITKEEVMPSPATPNTCYTDPNPGYAEEPPMNIHGTGAII